MRCTDGFARHSSSRVHHLAAGLTIATAGQERDLRKRLTPAEVDAVQTEVAGAGTSGLPAVTTRVLFGDPTKPGLYTIELRIAPNTTIRAHTHRDTRTAVVLDGLWLLRLRTKERAVAGEGFGARQFLHRTGWTIALCKDRFRGRNGCHQRIWSDGHGVREVTPH